MIEKMKNNKSGENRFILPGRFHREHPFIMDQKKRTRYLCILIALLVCDLSLLGVWYVKELDKKIPNHIYLFQNQKTILDWDAPVSCKWKEAAEVIKIIKRQDKTKKETENSFSLDEKVAVQASELGTYQAELKFFGVIHYKYIHFDVIEEEKVMPSGQAVGLYIRSKGLMVLGTTKVMCKDGLSREPAKNILQEGDMIQKIDRKSVKNIDQMVSELQKEKRKYITLTVFRNGSNIHLKMEKVLGKDGQYKLGAWLREDTEGIGTLSFITRKNQFAALGHGITDIDTGKVIPVDAGQVYPAVIEDIRKGEEGKPGELIGSVALGDNNRIGQIKNNTSLGITGDISKEEEAYREKDAFPIGLKHEVKKGGAWILCQLGDKVERFRIEIKEIDLSSKDNKGMVIRVTDPALLKRTGGIVQGMSGAPVIQNGKVVGAVTHVFVNEPEGGYATFIENML